MGEHKPILCLDFDGVLHSYASGWKGARNIPDPPVEGAMAFLLEAVDHFKVVIHSSRSRYFGGRRAMKAWLRYHIAEELWTRPTAAHRHFTAADREEDIALTASMFVRLRISFPLWKPAAHVTLDDRAVTFCGSWPAFSYLAQFTPWNREGANCPTYPIIAKLSEEDWWMVTRPFASVEISGSLLAVDVVITGLRDKLAGGWRLVPPEEAAHAPAT